MKPKKPSPKPYDPAYARLTSEGLRTGVADALNRVGLQGERIIVERHGKPVAAMVPLDDLAQIDALEDAADIAAAKRARAEGGRPIPLEELAKRYGIKLRRSVPKAAAAR